MNCKAFFLFWQIPPLSGNNFFKNRISLKFSDIENVLYCICFYYDYMLIFNILINKNGVFVTVNKLMTHIMDPLRDTLPYLPAQDLIAFKRTCTLFYKIVAEDDASTDKLGKAANFLEYGIVFINEGFLSPDQKYQALQCGYTIFNLRTILKVASWLAANGNTPIPPFAFATYQPSSLTPTEYIRGMKDPSRIYFYHYQVLGAPPHAGLQYGEHAFHNEHGMQSTPVEKAKACDLFVFECLEREFSAELS